MKPVKHQMARPNTLAVSMRASEARYATATTPITNHRANDFFAQVTTLIEPILIVFIAGVVGFMLVGVLQAMFKITSSIGQ